MPNQIILNKQICEDTWTLIAKDHQGELPNKPCILPLALWLEVQGANDFSSSTHHGVWLDSDEQACDVSKYIDQLPIIAINFPQFTDGRGYTIAAHLRQRHHYHGELRAIGDVLHDQLFYLQECGFNSFVLAPGKCYKTALAALDDFTSPYQEGLHNKKPLFLRHA